MACNLGCNKLRLVDRCVRCNPRYGDKNQAHQIYRATRSGGGSGSLKDAERAASKKKR